MNNGAPRRVVTDALARWAETVDPDAEVLEVGAGHYDHGFFLPGRRLTRFDADPTQHPDILGDAHNMPIDDESFDTALAISVLEHVANPYRVVQELFRVLRPGGEVFAWVPFYFAVHGFPGDVTRFTDEGIRLCFEEAGFEVLHVDAEPYSGFFFHLTNQVHFHLPRTSSRRWVRGANRALFMTFRAGFPLDKRLKMKTMYNGTELIARKPL
jgi:SAM-dependent methyltransferase